MSIKALAATAIYACFTQFSAQTLKATAAVTLITILGVSEAVATICVQESIQLERVQGIVLDEQGEILLSGATLTLERKGARFERVEISDHEGFFSFATVPEGDYALRVELDGFQQYEATIRVRKGANLGQALVATLPGGLEGCGHLEMTSGRKARHLQQEILNRDIGFRNRRREIGNALEPPERAGLRPDLVGTSAEPADRSDV